MIEDWTYQPQDKLAAEIADIMLAQLRLYPEMEFRDAVKLLYQQCFGPGHLVTNSNESLARLEVETRHAAPVAHVIEDIGGGYARVMLGAVESTGVSLPLLNRIFVASAARPKASIPDFEAKLEGLLHLCEGKILPFDPAESRTRLDRYRREGYPMLSHSASYKVTYHPAYRVIDSRFVPLFPVLVPLEQELRRRPGILAIDGRAAAGKSTAAALLSSLWPSSVISLDDFFLPADKRTETRLAEPGGNVDYERFKEEVLDNLASNSPFTYRVFDCSVMDFHGQHELSPRPLTIVEGSYSLQPYFGQYYDWALFMDIDPQAQLERVRQRNGEEMTEAFRSMWIPMEEYYFKSFGIRERADFVIRTT